MKRLLLTLILAISLARATTASAGTFTMHEGIEYASPNGHALLLDLRVPDGPGPHPVILYLHSGAWITGDRTGGPAIRQAKRGYAVASAEYRLAPQHIWPAQVEDAKAAIRWLRAHASRFNLDPNRIGVFGASAGGHIASVLGTSGGVASLEGLGHGNPQFSSRVKVVVDLFGPTDLLKIEEQKLPCIPLDGNSPNMPPSLLMGCPIQQCKEKTATANPITYVTKDDPPFLIMHGLLDCLVPWKQSAILHEALEAANVDSRLILIPNGDHGGRAFDSDKYEQAVDDFLDTHLRGPVTVKAKRRAVR
ncbi:MAG TPA: alpha/beta hydrolase [Thermoanaerobaculia bacterium]|nr:alpha/beta hydrolase [Thermoanaerobaculia bacterium]